MSVENNKMQVDIDNLKKQNVNDLSSIKELYRRLKEIEDRITQIKYIDTTLSKKLQKDYENLKKIISDENVQVELNNKIDEINTKIDNNNNEINTKIDKNNNEINNQLILKANLNDLTVNSNFDIKLGCTTLFDDVADSGKNTLTKMYEYFDNIIQRVTLKFEGNNFVTTSNINKQIENIEEFINYGGKIAGIKFHQQNLKSLIEEYGAEEIFTKYKECVTNFINNLSYKKLFDKVWILNEAGNDVFTSQYSDTIINTINDIKKLGYKVSTPYANAYAITDSDENILNANDFISLNLYPFNNKKGEKSNISDVAQRFNNEYLIIERYLKDKDLYITEFGCSSSWNSFNNPPIYKQDGKGLPIELFIHGFFRSRFMGVIKGAWLWYYYDAYTFAPKTLKSIKNRTVVYYG